MNTLPQAIAAYIDAANAREPHDMASCFHPDAIVYDEGKECRGREEIAAWAHDSSTRYQFTIEPAGLEEAHGVHTVRANVRGNFPGSPIMLNFLFKLRSGAIQTLEIAP